MEKLLQGEDIRGLTFKQSILTPTSLSKTDKSSLLEVDEDGFMLRYSDTQSERYPNVASIRANRPIPVGVSDFYFEMEILDMGVEGEMALGFCRGYSPHAINTLPGWEYASWGYHADSGKFYCFSSSLEIAELEPYGVGDVVGCYITSRLEIGFTKNGTVLGVVDVCSTGIFYPVIGMKSRCACVRVNFGQDKFRYDTLTWNSDDNK
ncbi:hypothetical protein AWENTII_011857 [Aspergillus wentii]